MASQLLRWAERASHSFNKRPARVSGLLVGLACARIGYDFLHPDWSWLVWLLFAGGFWLGCFAKSPRWTLWGLLVYLAAPVPLPRLATFGMGLAVVGLADRGAPEKTTESAWAPFMPVVAGMGAFVVLVATVSPGVLAADGGELQVVAAKWGVAHPPGYPLYTILAGTVTHGLPLGTPAWRVNLFSALTGAATVGLAVHVVQRETKNALGAGLAGLVLLASTTFWMTATQASVRPLMVLFTALLLEAALAYRRARREDYPGTAALLRFGLAAGLGVTHHGSILFVGCVFALGMAVVDRGNRRRWWLAPVAALAGMLPILYLPLRAGGYLAPDYITTLDGLRYHVLAEGFAGDMFALAAPRYWPERLQVMTEVFQLQWHVWVLPLAAFGWVWAVRRDRWLGSLLGGGFLVHTFVAGTYRAPQIVEYTLPAYLLAAIALGWGVSYMRRPFRLVASALALYAGANSFLGSWMTMQRLSASEEARVVAEAFLEATPERTNILATWHRVTPIWYLQEVEGARPDVKAYYVTARGAPTPMAEWAIAIDEHMAVADSVMVTQLYPEVYRFLPYTFENHRVSHAPREVTEPSERIAFGPHQLIRAEVAFPAEVNAGETMPVTLTWGLSETAPYGTLTAFVHLGVPGEPPVAQLDLPLQTTAAGAVTITYDVFVLATTLPGEWSLYAGIYTPEGPLATDDGEVRVELGRVRVQPARFPLPTQHPLWIRMGDARLRGWDYDTTLPDAPLLYLHWWLERQDCVYAVKVFDGEENLLATASAPVAGQTGYWTSVHAVPPGAERLRVEIAVGDRRMGEFRLPSLPEGEHYVLFGDVGALVDWRVDPGDGEVNVATEWLAAGATFAEVGIRLDVVHANETQDGAVPPITDAIPTTKWAYGHTIHSEQTVQLEAGAPLAGVRVSLYDLYVGRTLSVADTRLTIGGSGVILGP